MGEIPDRRRRKTTLGRDLRTVPRDARARCLVVINFSPGVYSNYRLRVPFAGVWTEIFNSDSSYYGGTNVGNGPVRTADGPVPELRLTVPPLAAIYLIPES